MLHYDSARITSYNSFTMVLFSLNHAESYDSIGFCSSLYTEQVLFLASFSSYSLWCGLSVSYDKGLLDISKLLLSISLGVICAYLYVQPEFKELRPMAVFPIVIWSCLILGLSIWLATFASSYF